MNKRIHRFTGRSLQTLPARLILFLIGFILLASLAIGVPALWFVNTQLDQQTRKLLDQSANTTQALYLSDLNNLIDLAELISERPTLPELMKNQQVGELTAYLDQIKGNTDLNAIVLCDLNEKPLGVSGDPALSSLCAIEASSGYHLDSQIENVRIWLYATHPVFSGNIPMARIVAGQLLDQAFLDGMKAQTGVEYVLVYEGRLVSTSLTGLADITALGLPSRSSSQQTPTSQYFNTTFQNTPYQATSLDLPGILAQDWLLFSTKELNQTRQQVAQMIALGAGTLCLMGIVIGLLLARTISRPLAELESRAQALRSGDLANPVRVQSNLAEINAVASALEEARTFLQHSLAELKKEKAWEDHLLDSIIEGIITLDQYGRLTYMSRGAEKITAWEQDRAVGLSVNEVFRPIEAGKLFTQTLPPPGQQMKIRIRSADGKEKTLAITGARLAPPVAGKARVALVVRDVSAEESLHRLLGDFLSNISHEFRTPLSALAASLELLHDQLPDLSQPELEELIGFLRLGVLNLQTLIDNLLEGASIEAGRFRVVVRSSNLAGIVTETAAMLSPLFEKVHQTLSIDLPVDLPPIQADPRRTGQVLVNLLSNASKFSPPGSSIDLQATCEGESVCVSVADRGPGIPPGSQGDIFRRFIHLESDTDRAKYGAGLGLSVVKMIVESQGGQVGVQDREGGGSIFWFTLQTAKEKVQPV